MHKDRAMSEAGVMDAHSIWLHGPLDNKVPKGSGDGAIVQVCHVEAIIRQVTSAFD